LPPNGAQNSSWMKPHALHLDGEEDHEEPDSQRQGKSGVDVGGGYRAPVFKPQHVLVQEGHDVDGQEVHRVHQEHPHEYRERQGCDEALVAVEDASGLFVDEFDQKFHEGLTFGGHTRGGAAHNPGQKSECEDTEYHRGEDGVHVPGPERRFPGLRVERQVVLDVAGGCQLVSCGHVVLRSNNARLSLPGRASGPTLLSCLV